MRQRSIGQSRVAQLRLWLSSRIDWLGARLDRLDATLGLYANGAFKTRMKENPMRKIALWLVAASLCLLAVRVFADTLEQLSLEKVAKDDQQCTDADHDCECEIDEHFKRDQSTVHHGVLLVAQRMREDAEFEAFIQEIERSFTQRRPAILN